MGRVVKRIHIGVEGRQHTAFTGLHYAASQHSLIYLFWEGEGRRMNTHTHTQNQFSSHHFLAGQHAVCTAELLDTF